MAIRHWTLQTWLLETTKHQRQKIGYRTVKIFLRSYKRIYRQLRISKIHNVFHVSNLKKTIGQHIAPSTELPPLDDEGILVLIPERILQVRERKLWNKVIREYLVKWNELPMEDATWEGEQVLQHPSLQLLEEKQFQAERIVMSSSN